MTAGDDPRCTAQRHHRYGARCELYAGHAGPHGCRGVWVVDAAPFPWIEWERAEAWSAAADIAKARAA